MLTLSKRDDVVSILALNEERSNKLLVQSYLFNNANFFVFLFNNANFFFIIKVCGKHHRFLDLILTARETASYPYSYEYFRVRSLFHLFKVI